MKMDRRNFMKISAISLAASTARPVVRAEEPAASVAARPSGSPLDILILGGTGLTGPHQVRYALARGHRIAIFNRGRKQPEWPGHVEQLLGDRDKNDYASIAAEIKKGRRWDICIDNPSSVPAWIRDAAKVVKGHVGAYTMISSLSAYADNATPGQDESAPVAKFDGDALKETMASLRADMGKYSGLKAATEAETRKHLAGC
jgi:2'-hydroxyisoflavone reductase